MAKQVVDHAKLLVGERTYGERDAGRRQIGDQFRVVERPVAMIDAVHAQDIYGFAHIRRRSLLAGMGDQQQTFVLGLGEDVGELGGRMAQLRRVEADAGELVSVHQRLLKSRHGLICAQVTQKAENELGGNTQLVRRLLLAARDAVDHSGKRHTAVGMGLGIEEDLGMAHVVVSGPSEISQGQLIEVLLVPQHLHALVVQVEELLQIGKAVGRAQFVDGAVRDPDGVTSRQLEHHLRLQRAFDVKMQFRLRQAGYEVVRHARASQFRVNGRHYRRAPVAAATGDPPSMDPSGKQPIGRALYPARASGRAVHFDNLAVLQPQGAVRHAGIR